jgi:hypothetical protein
MYFRDKLPDPPPQTFSPVNWSVEDPRAVLRRETETHQNYNPVHTGPPIATHCPLAAYTCVMNARKEFWDWCHVWGEVDYMGLHLKQCYDEAVAAGTVGDWFENSNRQLNQGLAVLRTLQEVMFVELPKDEMELRDLWRQVRILFNDLWSHS